MDKPMDSAKNKTLYDYDDGDIPKVDLPASKDHMIPEEIPAPLPEAVQHQGDEKGED